MTNPVLTMIPGPTPVHERILEALARPTVSHQAPSFVDAYRACLENMRRIVRSDKAQPFVVSGSGTQAMEMALVNLVEPGSRLLVVSHGFFGDRWIDLAASFGIRTEVLRAEWGQAVEPAELERRLAEGSHRAVAITHVDTSTGTLAPIESYAELLRGRDEITILDGVCATAGIDERFDDWGLDVLLTGAQKALGTPPGLAILLVSPRAMERRHERESVPAFSCDMLRWLPIMENPSGYFSTPPVNEILALHEASRIVLDEGLDARFARHAGIARAVRAGLAALELEIFTDAGCRADTLTVIRHREGVDDVEFRTTMAARGVVVAGALGPIAGRAFRIGHMGNIGAAEVRRTLQAVEESLAQTGGGKAGDRAVEAAAAELEAL